MTEKKERTDNTAMTVGLTIRMTLREKVKCGKCGMNEQKWFAEGFHKREKTISASTYMEGDLIAGGINDAHHCFFHMVAAMGFEQIRLPRMIRMLREIRSPANFKKVFEIEQNRLDMNVERLYTLGHELNTTVRCHSCGHLGRVVYMKGKPGVSGWPHQKAILGEKWLKQTQKEKTK